MPSHPSDRNSRRELARIYDGDRTLIREMETKYRQMWARDILALDEEWSCEVPIAGYIIAFQAEDYLRGHDA